MDFISHPRETCPLEWKGKEMGRNEERPLNFLDFIGQNYRAIWLRTCAILLDKGSIILKAIGDNQGCPLGSKDSYLVFNRPDDIRPKLWACGHPAEPGGQDPAC